MPRQLIIVVSSAVVAIYSSSVALAVDIPIVNAGFEEPTIEDGNWVTGGTGWDFGIYYSDDREEWIEGGDETGTDAGIWNPDTVIGFEDEAYEGENNGWAFSVFGVDAGLSQTLEAKLLPNTEYNLQVQVGNPLYNQTDDTSEFRLELLAGGVLLESYTSESPEAGVWELQGFSYNSGTAPARAGQPLGIRLISVEFDACVDGGCEVDFDEVSLTALSASALGDFNLNGVLDAADIDLLSAEVRAGTNANTFDLNGDGVVNNADRDFWVEDKSVSNSFFGDSNLDGEFNSSDFVAVFSKGLFENQQAAGWDAGDWDGDGVFGSGDFVLAFQRRGYETGPRVAAAAVPEPASVGLVLLGFVGLGIGTRRPLRS